MERDGAIVFGTGAPVCYTRTGAWGGRPGSAGGGGAGGRHGQDIFYRTEITNLYDAHQLGLGVMFTWHRLDSEAGKLLVQGGASPAISRDTCSI